MNVHSLGLLSFAKVEGASTDFQPLRAGSIISGICGANANYLITSGVNKPTLKVSWPCLLCVTIKYFLLRYTLFKLSCLLLLLQKTI